MQWMRRINLDRQLLLPSIIGFFIASCTPSETAKWLLGIVVIIAIVIRPKIGIGITLLSVPFGPRIFFVPFFDLTQMLFFISFLSWIARGLREKQIIIPSRKLTLPLSLFIYAISLSLLKAPSLQSGLVEWLKWVEIALILWMMSSYGSHKTLSNQLDKRRLPDYVWIVGVLLIAGTIQALLGIEQFGFSNNGPEHFRILTRFYRASGSFGQPNPFGGYMNLTIFLSLGMLVGVFMMNRMGSQRNAEEKRALFWIILILLFITIMSGMGLVFSWSRGAWLGFGAGLFTFIVFISERRLYGIIWLLLFVFGVGLVIIGDILPVSLVERVGSSLDIMLNPGEIRETDITIANYATLERLAFWQAALDMARDSLWIGIGIGNYEIVYPEYALLNWPQALGHAHNYYLNILAETGVVGLGSYLLFWTAVFSQTIRLLGRLMWPQRGVVLGLLAAWTALSVHHLVDNLYVSNIYLHVGVMLGLLYLLENSSQKSVSIV